MKSSRNQHDDKKKEKKSITTQRCQDTHTHTLQFLYELWYETWVHRAVDRNRATEREGGRGEEEEAYRIYVYSCIPSYSSSDLFQVLCEFGAHFVGFFRLDGFIKRVFKENLWRKENKKEKGKKNKAYKG